MKPNNTIDEQNAAADAEHIAGGKLQSERVAVPQAASRDRKKGSFCIRALNYENQVEVKHLASLYERAYGLGYPFGNVYDPLYWSRQGESYSKLRRYVNVLAVEGTQITGHLGFRFDVRSRCGELMFVALAPECKAQVIALSRAAWKMVENIARSQDWFGVYHYCAVSHPASQVISNKCFATRELAILIDCLPAGTTIDPGAAGKESRTSVLLAYRQLTAEQPAAMHLYPPEPHREFIQKLYGSLGIPVEMALPNAYLEANVRKPLFCSTPASLRQPQGFKVQYRRRFGVFHYYLEPSKITDVSQVLAAAAALADNQHRVYIQVAMDDPSCPPVCGMLAAAGFRFSGIYPPVGSRPYVIYSMFSNGELAQLTLYSSQAKEIRQYMMQG